MSRFNINWNRLTIAVAFFIHENNYFGWNPRPQSPEECLADGLVVLMVLLAFGEPRP